MLLVRMTNETFTAAMVLDVAEAVVDPILAMTPLGHL